MEPLPAEQFTMLMKALMKAAGRRTFSLEPGSDLHRAIVAVKADAWDEGCRFGRASDSADFPAEQNPYRDTP